MSEATDLRRAGARYRRAKANTDTVRDELKAVVSAAAAAGMSEVQIADISGVTRMTVRNWLGKGWPGQRHAN
jgi:predicted transcriptional regulator